MNEYDYLIENVIDDPWIVEIKGYVNGNSYEISIVRKSNKHGFDSWGWFDKNKLLISHNGGHCRWPLAPGLGDLMVMVAHRYCAMLNNGTIPEINSPLLELLKP